MRHYPTQFGRIVGRIVSHEMSNPTEQLFQVLAPEKACLVECLFGSNRQRKHTERERGEWKTKSLSYCQASDMARMIGSMPKRAGVWSRLRLGDVV
jgi:hypothetical protein